MSTEMANDHPFQQLFENLGNIPTFHAESVNRGALEVLAETLAVPLERSGRCIMLRAPRAGHGKTHLLTRIQRQLAATHEFVALKAPFGCRIDAASVLKDTLRGLARPLPASGGLCGLDLVARKLFSHALQPLVKSGEVPCQDREGALAALRLRPMETFDFHNPNAVTARWARDNFEVLGKRLSLGLAASSEVPVSAVDHWVEWLFRFSSTPLESPGRTAILDEAVQGGSGGEEGRLEALLGLMSLLKRVVLVADDLELFSSDQNAGLSLVTFVGSVRQAADRVDVILSLNQDLWEGAFVPRLSGGMADRLAEVVIELEPLRDEEMEALLESRVPGLGRRVLARIDPHAAGSHARGLIRAAGIEWLKATAMDSAPPREISDPDDLPAVETPLPAVPAASVPPAVPEVAAFQMPADPPQSTVDPPLSGDPLWTPLEPEAPAPVTEKPAAAVAVPAPQPSPPPSAAATVSAAEEPSASTASPAPPDSNRVDELLRQFRERYGSGSL